jgi:hypothetical protein
MRGVRLVMENKHSRLIKAKEEAVSKTILGIGVRPARTTQLI